MSNIYIMLQSSFHFFFVVSDVLHVPLTFSLVLCFALLSLGFDFVSF